MWLLASAIKNPDTFSSFRLGIQYRKGILDKDRNIRNFYCFCHKKVALTSKSQNQSRFQKRDANCEIRFFVWLIDLGFSFDHELQWVARGDPDRASGSLLLRLIYLPVILSTGKIVQVDYVDSCYRRYLFTECSRSLTFWDGSLDRYNGLRIRFF